MILLVSAGLILASALNLGLRGPLCEFWLDFLLWGASWLLAGTTGLSSMLTSHEEQGAPWVDSLGQFTWQLGSESEQQRARTRELGSRPGSSRT